MHAPKNCSVIAVGRQGVAQSSTRLRPRSFDGKIAHNVRVHFFPQMRNRPVFLKPIVLKLKVADSTISSSSTWSRRFPPLQKLLRTNSTRKLAQSDDKSSPRAVLDGPEGEGGENQECYSTSSHEVSRRGHNGLWRRLSDMKLWLPFLRNIGDDSTRGSDVGSAFAEDHKPAWRCFSFQEISVATNDFHPGDSSNTSSFFFKINTGSLSSSQVQVSILFSVKKKSLPDEICCHKK